MDRFERIYRLWRVLSVRRTPVAIAALAETLECSERNAKKIIEKLRDSGAPILYHHELRGYYLDPAAPGFELPGLWFNASELHALLTSHQLLADVQPGWLNDYIAPLKGRIEKLLGDAAHDFSEVRRRVRILQIAARPTDLDHFQKISEALIGRRQLKMLYHGRARDKLSERIVSPQRLVYYRSNWLLDAWCHAAGGLRSFSVDRLQPVVILDEPACDIDDDELDAHFTRSYGIFAGPADNIAHLMFSADIARWVADEHWHPEEQGKVLADGRYELKIPYGNPTELIMDILKYGPEVEVLAPDSLRDVVAERARQTARLYEK